MNIVSLEAVYKQYSMEPLLEEVTFSLEHNEKVGIIGPNGSGKTTLLRLIAGVEPPDRGRVTLARGLLLAYLPQDPSFEADQKVLDAVFDQGNETSRRLHDYEAACQALEAAGGEDEQLLRRVTDLAHQLDMAGGWELEAKAKAILSRLGIEDTDTPVSTLSGGQRKRVALARALILRPDLLILDEPTNHLDADTIAWLEAYLIRYTGVLLLVTHDRYFLNRVTNRMLEIERARVHRFEGNYTYYLEKKEERALQRGAEVHKRERLIHRELAWLRRGAKARTTKQKARIDRAEALMAMPKETSDPTIQLAAPSARLGKKVIELEAISKSYDGLTLIKDFSYKFSGGDRIGIIGPNGAGKTTVLEIIAGRVRPDAGRVETGQTVVVGYYDQQSRALKDELRVIDYIKEIAENVRTADGSVITASQMLERFLFPAAVQYTFLGRLSGGERRRLYLLRLLMGSPNVLLLDEPTNDFDIATLIALETYLDAFAGCLIVVSHDRYFLDRTVEHLIRFEGQGRLRVYPGNYSAFLKIRAQEETDQVAEQVSRKPKIEKPNPQAPATPTAGPRKLTYKERLELDELETRITLAETQKTELEAQLAAETSDFSAVSTLYTELQHLIEQLDRDLERWAELAELA